jgi:hypothetical protein
LKLVIPAHCAAANMPYMGRTIDVENMEQRGKNLIFVGGHYL